MAMFSVDNSNFIAKSAASYKKILCISGVFGVYGLCVKRTHLYTLFLSTIHPTA